MTKMKGTKEMMLPALLLQLHYRKVKNSSQTYMIIHTTNEMFCENPKNHDFEIKSIMHYSFYSSKTSKLIKYTTVIE